MGYEIRYVGTTELKHISYISAGVTCTINCVKETWMVWIKICMFSFFFLSEFSFTDTDDPQDNRRKDGTIFYFILPLPRAHKHSDFYLEFCMWDDYHIFLIAQLVFTRLLLDVIYHLIKLPFDWSMMWCQFLFVLIDGLILDFRYSNFTRETSGFELASTIALVLQMNQVC